MSEKEKADIQKELEDATGITSYLMDFEEESELEESGRIVDGFYKEDQHRRDIQAVLDQATEAIREGSPEAFSEGEEPSVEAVAEEETAAEAEGEQAAEEPAAEEPAKGEQATEEPAAEGPATEEISEEQAEATPKAAEEVQKAGGSSTATEKRSSGRKLILAILIACLAIVLVLLALLTVGRDTELGRSLSSFFGAEAPDIIRTAWSNSVKWL